MINYEISHRPVLLIYIGKYIRPTVPKYIQFVTTIYEWNRQIFTLSISQWLLFLLDKKRLKQLLTTKVVAE